MENPCACHVQGHFRPFSLIPSISDNSFCSSPRSDRFLDGRFEENQPHFLDSCFLCNKPLGHNRDIFMYRFPEKLDLQCLPGKPTATIDWLTSSNLKGLKKLYIRGGKLSDLGQYQDFEKSIGDALPVNDKWKIEVLRLKYLSELELDWREMQELLPDLLYLEKVNCPKLTFFPCDESRVWMNKTKLKQLEETRS